VQIPSQKLREYETWKAIKHFWGPGGPLQLGSYPHTTVPGSGTDLAKKLKQSHICTHNAGIAWQLTLINAEAATAEGSKRNNTQL
jgi:hypothetical protein